MKRILQAKQLYIYIYIYIIISTNVFAQGNVGIGTNSPDNSAKLEISTASDAPNDKKGLMIPNVELTATNKVDPIALPATSLLVYNTVTAGVAPYNVSPGYYYWDGTKWVRLYNTGNIKANNGLSVDNDVVQLGGPLTKQTTVSGLSATNTMSFTGSGADMFNVDGSTFSVDGATDKVGIGTTVPQSKLDVKGNLTIGSTYGGTNAAPADGAIIQGKVGIGNNNPSNNAILDLTNSIGASSTALAIQLPSAVNSALAGSPTPPNINNSALANGAITNGGLMVYNQTTGCLQYYNAVAKQWYDMSITTAATTPEITGCTVVGAREQGVSYSVAYPDAGMTYTWAVSGGGANIVSGQGTTTITVNWSTGNTIGGQTMTTAAPSTPYVTTISVTAKPRCGANTQTTSSITVNAGGRSVFQCQNSVSASDQIFTVPANSCIALHKVKLWGAGGGCGGSGTKRGSGGAGGFVRGGINFPIGSYAIMAGQGGFKANSTQQYGFGGPDRGGNSGGSGGGLAGIFSGTANRNTPMVIAGGGGGGAYSNNQNCYGGAGGGTTGGSGGKDNASTVVATGGTQSAGGTRGSYSSGYYGENGAYLQGGGGNSSNWDGGGGGGGYYGGGGGGGYYGGGGGGGSSYVTKLVAAPDGTAVVNDQGNTAADNADHAPSSNGTSEAGYSVWGSNSGSSFGSVGYGGGSYNGRDGGPALIIIEW